MSTRPRIFISYSSKDRALVERVRDALQPSRGSDQLELWLDVDKLKPGQPWEPFLHRSMAECDAALLLLTKNSVESDYVLKEATILAWRMSLDKTFRFFVARDPAVTDDDLKDRRFSPVRLEHIHEIRSREANEIAEEVRAGLEGLVVRPTPFDELVDALSVLLSGSGSGAIEKIARNLSVDTEWVSSDEEQTRQVKNIARQLLGGQLGSYELETGTRAQGTVDGLNRLIGDLADTTDPETLRKVLRLLAPYWIDGETAGKMALLPAHEERRALALNGNRVTDYTATLFLERGHLSAARNYYFLEIAGGNAGSLVEHYTAQICEAVSQQPPFAYLADEDQGTVVKELREMAPTRYVVIPHPYPDEEELVQLMDRFPSVSFVLWTGPDLEKDEARKRIDWASPAVDPDVELRGFRDWSEATETIRREEYRH